MYLSRDSRGSDLLAVSDGALNPVRIDSILDVNNSSQSRINFLDNLFARHVAYLEIFEIVEYVSFHLSNVLIETKEDPWDRKYRKDEWTRYKVWTIKP